MAEPDGTEENAGRKRVGSSMSMGQGKPYEFKGGEPKFSYVGRTVTVDKTLFDAFKSKSKGRRSSGLFTAFLQPRDDSENVQDDNGSLTKRRHRSIFGLRVLSPYNSLASFWSGIVMTLDATYTAFFVPILLAFLGGQRSNDVGHWYTLVEIIAGCIFFADIIFGFHIGFIIKYDYKKKIVMDGKSVLWYYRTHGGLWIDVASVVPLFLEVAVQVAGEGTRVATLATFFRIFRLIRLLKLIKNLYFTLFAGTIRKTPLLQHISMGFIYFLSVLYSLAFMVNVLGCLLYFTAWAQDQEFKGTWLDGNQGNDLENYLTSIYWAVTTITTVGYGDLAPQTWIEEIIIMVLMITHIMLFGLLIGTMTELVKSSTRRARASEAYKTRVTEVGEWLQSRNVSPSMAKKVHAYYAEVWIQDSGFDEASIFEELPRTLRNEIAFNITKDLLHGLSCFKEVDDKALTQLAGRLVPHGVPPGHEVVRQGDPADSLFILEEGTLILQQNEEEVYRLHGPATCGESTILGMEIPELSIRAVTLRAFTSCHIWELKVKDIVPLFAPYPHLKEDLIEGYRLRMVQRLNRNSLGASALEGNVEAELGLDMTTSDAVLFKTQLGLTSTENGTFSKLMKDALRKSHTRNRSLENSTHFQTVDELQDHSAFSHVSTTSFSDAISVMNNLHDELKKQGVNGMLEFVQQMRKLENPSGELCLVDFQTCMDGLSLTPHQLLNLFVYLDPLESGKVQVESIIGLIRRGSQVDRLTVQYLEAIFFYLCPSGSDEIDNTKLVTSCHVEHHRDVLSGRRTGVEVLMAVLMAVKDNERVALEDFLALNTDMALCMDDVSVFKKMVLDMWGVPNVGALYP